MIKIATFLRSDTRSQTVRRSAKLCNEAERVRSAFNARVRVLYRPKYREVGKEHASKRSQ